MTMGPTVTTTLEVVTTTTISMMETAKNTALAMEVRSPVFSGVVLMEEKRMSSTTIENDLPDAAEEKC